MLTAVAILAITTGIFLIATVVLGVLYARERAALFDPCEIPYDLWFHKLLPSVALRGRDP